MLGERYAGTLVSDFLPTYDRLPYKAQKCIPHLLRDVEKSAARSPAFAASPFRKKLKRAAKDLLRLKAKWAAAGGDLGDDAYFLLVSRLADRLDALAETGAASDDRDVRRLAARLDRHADALAAFLLDEDLPGDNNAAERALRPAVVIRKISGGHRGGTTAAAAAVVHERPPHRPPAGEEPDRDRQTPRPTPPRRTTLPARRPVPRTRRIGRR